MRFGLNLKGESIVVRTEETVETVNVASARWATSLKRGVNENAAEMQTDRTKRIAVILGVTIVVGALGARIIYDRVVHGNDAKNACINNLVWIAGSKKIAAQEYGLRSGATVNKQDLGKYIVGEFPNCPAGGTYTINPIGTEPTCSVSGHSLQK